MTFGTDAAAGDAVILDASQPSWSCPIQARVPNTPVGNCTKAIAVNNCYPYSSELFLENEASPMTSRDRRGETCRAMRIYHQRSHCLGWHLSRLITSERSKGDRRGRQVSAASRPPCPSQAIQLYRRNVGSACLSPPRVKVG